MVNIETKTRKTAAKNRLRAKHVIITAVLSMVLIFGILIGLKNLVADLINANEAVVDDQTTETLDRVYELATSDDPELDVTVEWNDVQVQNAIHKMSHQKVLADVKWGAIKITKKRLETLSMIIDQNKDHLEHYDLYRDILDRWMEGDFSRADEDHNAIWELQGGTIGKAYGLQTKEEEQEFIKNTFGDGE
ncbi:hypothetical protein [Geobacillus phage TP-84]|uniref:Uncharacterized protein n=1 Tax=Geobacillus phage TP-84 TaxID=1965361 RepID=A0A1U9WQI6_9CAUD|nr:hypothetical protein MUK65_gp30 [Geobacillus phage TP-84]AQY55047.1 hypothetical protein [Geobacillus phage TP-84]